MGQKVNPHGIRVGVIKDWDSRWFASKKDFSDNLVEDHKIRTELKAQLKDAGVPKIEIERTVDPSTSAPRVTVNIYCAKPGMVIGKGGEERVALQNKLTKEYGKTVIVNVIEVKSASTNAQLVAEDIARQLENRVTFRRAMKQCMRNAMSPRDRSTVPAKGIKAMCSGRLGGADIARTESYHEPPKALTAFSIRISSVATQTESKTSFTCSYTRCIMGFPFISANGFPGKRVEAYLAGIIPINFIILYRFVNWLLLFLRLTGSTYPVRLRSIRYLLPRKPYREADS